jgi:uncharacterized protein YycO
MESSYPGRIGLTQISGVTGQVIRVLQGLNGSGLENFEHAYMDLGDGTLIEAEPGGARIRPLYEYHPDNVYWCDNIYAGMTPEQKIMAAVYARALKGTPYSYLDYMALIAHHFGVNSQALQDYIASSHHMICSQLADYACQLAGYHLFNNRWNGYVAPGDLYRLDKAMAPR